MKTTNKLTLAAAKAILRPLGVTITHKSTVGEYRVNLANGTEEIAYYTDDLEDALGTGKAMFAHGKQCRWFLRCDNAAVTTQSHPILGEVLICARCQNLGGK